MISIIIPTFNRAKILNKTLPSYLEQEQVDEIIIVDDCSTDNTQEVVAEYSAKYGRIEYLKQPQKGGLPASRNLGLDNSKGMILFGEDDVVLEKNYVNQLVRCMKKNNADIVGGRLIYIAPNESFGDALERSNKIQKPIIDPNLLIGRYDILATNDVQVPFIHACSLIKREVFDEIRYDENYRGSASYEDADLSLSATKKGFRVFFCPHTVCYHLSITPMDMGGTRSVGRLRYEYWAIKNNYYFLKKHYPFLKQKLGLNRGLYAIAFNYALYRTYILGYLSFSSLRRRVKIKKEGIKWE